MVDIFIGNKTYTTYVKACISQVDRCETDLRLLARGRAISRAVDVAELLRTRFLVGRVSVKNISIYTEEVPSTIGAPVCVSVIAIELKIKGEIDEF